MIRPMPPFGRPGERIPYGNEIYDWVSACGPTCGDCGFPLGELHKPHCDIEECQHGGQLLSCARCSQ